MPRPAAPPLEPRTPLCSICGDETDYMDEDFVCLDCEVRWPSETFHLDDGTWDEPDAEQCPSELIPWPGHAEMVLREARFRCERTADHARSHVNHEWIGEWDDKDPHAHLIEAEAQEGGA